MKAVLSIAGSDSSGGAGIQADIKTITAHNLYAETAITALTAQNTLGVSQVAEVDSDFVRAQVKAVFDDIRPDAVKVGMVFSAGIVAAIAEGLACYHANNVVVDPVMVSTSGARLINDDAVEALKEGLFPLADLITPNISEAEVLVGEALRDEGSRERAARALQHRFGCAVLIKGGHDTDSADDLLVNKAGETTWLRQRRIDTGDTHGTGCTLSSAIACGLAQGSTLEEAVFAAKRYITGALEHGIHVGKGSGPLNHMWNLGFREPDGRRR